MKIQELPNNATLKIFHSSRKLTDSEVSSVLEEFDSFEQNWQAHGANVFSAREMRYNQFLLVGVDESKVRLSGCSRDSLIHAMEAIERKLGLTFLDSPQVVYRENDKIKCAERMEFKKIASQGLVNAETIVFNNIIESVSDLNKWEVPMKDSWHARAFLPKELA
ncbi:MAG: ABC transporter ATPase [Calditrichaeota bacterium]|nr:MAG: ABC transporter ATPase [Calditrichota bacterium]